MFQFVTENKRRSVLFPVIVNPLCPQSKGRLVVPLNADNPMRDALEIIRGTDVISAEKKRSLVRGLKGLRHRHCPASRNCAECLTQQRCVTAIADLLGS